MSSLLQNIGQWPKGCFDTAGIHDKIGRSIMKGFINEDHCTKSKDCQNLRT